MIVTCPKCSAKYRVRNESVPPEGARMRCPKCATLFLAKPPADPAKAAPSQSGMFPAINPQGSPAPAPTPPPAAAAPAPVSGANPFAPPPSAPAPNTAMGGAPATGQPAPTNLSKTLPLGSMNTGNAASPAPSGANPFAMPSGTPGAPSANPFAPPPASNAAGPAAGPRVAPLGTPATNPFGAPLGGPPPANAAPAADPFDGLDVDMADDDVSVDDGGVSSNVEVGGVVIADDNPAFGKTSEKTPKKEKKKKEKKVKTPRHGPLVPPVIGTAVLGLGTLFLLGGVCFALWAGHFLPLDGVLMPLAENNLSVRPPISSLGKDDPDVARLKDQADKLSETNPIEALVLYRRVLKVGPNKEASDKLQYVSDQMRLNP